MVLKTYIFNLFCPNSFTGDIQEGFYREYPSFFYWKLSMFAICGHFLGQNTHLTWTDNLINRYWHCYVFWSCFGLFRPKSTSFGGGRVKICPFSTWIVYKSYNKYTRHHISLHQVENYLNYIKSVTYGAVFGRKGKN